MTSDVMKGSALSSLIFITYVNDVSNCFSMVKRFLYADYREVSHMENHISMKLNKVTVFVLKMEFRNLRSYK